MPGVPIIGNTSYTGVITPTEKGKCAIEGGKEAARKAMEAAGKKTASNYFYMAAPPVKEEFFLKGITEVIGRVPFFGGSAADNTISGNWKLYTDKGYFADGVAVAFFYSDVAIVNQFTGAYHETKDTGVVTKVDGNRTLVEIDGEPALKKYAVWRGMDSENLKDSALLAASVVSPLGVKDRLGDLVAIRHPMNGNDDDSIALGNKITEGTAIIRMEASVDELISSTGGQLNELKKKMPNAGAYHLVHCGGLMLSFTGLHK